MSRTYRRVKREDRRRARYEKHFTDRNYHHLTPRSRGGSDERYNLLLIDIEKHNNWHKVFGLLNLDEVISLLLRIQRAKTSQK
jgi:hypothetical protein